MLRMMKLNFILLSLVQWHVVKIFQLYAHCTHAHPILLLNETFACRARCDIFYERRWGKHFQWNNDFFFFTEFMVKSCLQLNCSSVCIYFLLSLNILDPSDVELILQWWVDRFAEMMMRIYHPINKIWLLLI